MLGTGFCCAGLIRGPSSRPGSSKCARVLKFEGPDGGDLCWPHCVSDARTGTDSTLFHAINQGKASIALDFKSNEDPSIARSDVWVLVVKAQAG